MDENEIRDTELTAEKPDYESEICEIIRSNASPRAMCERLSDYHETDIAGALFVLSPVERKKLYRIISVEDLSNILDFADEDAAAVYLGEMDIRRAAQIVSRMDADTAAAALKEMDKERRGLIIELTDEEIRRDIALLASFDEDEIGSRMTTNFILVKRGSTVKQAMNSLIAQAPENDNISTLFVEDASGSFYGAIDLKDLIIARENTELESLIRTSYPYIYGTEEIDDCIEKLKDYYEDLIPVLDNDNHIIGVITSQSIVEVVDDEMSEDYAKLAGFTAEEELEEPMLASLRKRLPWLIVLLFLGLGVSSVVGAFERIISRLTLIIAFQSLILGMAGNVGTQSLAVTIRILMDENLTGGQKVRHIFKEMKLGLMDGLLLGSTATVCVGLYIHLFKARTLASAFCISGCVGLAMVLSMMISSTVGTLIPMFFKKVNIDPAVASGPLISTVNDLVAVIAYYGLAWILLINWLHLGS